MNLKYLLIDLSIYSCLIPSIWGAVNWWYLPKAFKIYWGLMAINTILGITSSITSSKGIDNHFIYPMMAVNAGVFYGWFYFELIQNRTLKWSVLIAYAAYVGYVFYDFWRHGVQLFNLKLFTFIDVVGLLLSILLFNKVIRSETNITHKPIFWLLLSLVTSSLYSMAITQVGESLALYLSNKWQDVFWLNINPLINLVHVGLITYAFYLTRRQRGTFAQIPELEA